MRRAAWILLFLAMGVGCSKERRPGDLLAPGSVGMLVVEAQLLVGEPLPAVRVTETQSPADPYDRSHAAAEGAVVSVSASTGGTVPYHADPDEPGVYRPEGAEEGTAAIVQPLVGYSLRVEAADGRVVTAATTTPDRFHVDEWNLIDPLTLAPLRRLATRDDFTVDPDSVYQVASNQLVYQEGLLEARFARAAAAGYQIGIRSLDIGSPYVIDASFLSADVLARLERDTSSPPFDAVDGVVRLPWYAIFFEGRYDISIYAVDRNWFDLARSIQLLSSANIAFGSNAGDGFEAPIFHVNGGIGLFGSAAKDDVGFTVHPRP